MRLCSARGAGMFRIKNLITTDKKITMKNLRPLFLPAAGWLAAALLMGCGDGGSNPDISPRAAAAIQPGQMSQQAAPGKLPSQWVPVASDTWEWQLQGTIDTSYNVKIYDVDLFNTDAATLTELKKAGRKVVCYFSAGSSENWRPDYNRFKAADKGKAMDGWPGENWLDVRSSNVRAIMTARLDIAVQKGCDGVEPDNVDGYENATGFPLTPQNQIDFNSFLATQAHQRNLAVALKNDVDQLDTLQPLFDLAVNEQCHEFDECSGYRAFTSVNKPVLNAEYADVYHTAAGQKSLCAAARAANIRTLVLALDLDDSYRFSCD